MFAEHEHEGTRSASPGKPPKQRRRKDEAGRDFLLLFLRRRGDAFIAFIVIGRHSRAREQSKRLLVGSKKFSTSRLRLRRETYESRTTRLLPQPNNKMRLRQFPAARHSSCENFSDAEMTLSCPCTSLSVGRPDGQKTFLFLLYFVPTHSASAARYGRGGGRLFSCFLQAFFRCRVWSLVRLRGSALSPSAGKDLHLLATCRFVATRQSLNSRACDNSSRYSSVCRRVMIRARVQCSPRH